MIDGVVMSDNPPAFSGDAPVAQPVSPPPSVEQRLRRLEDAVAGLQDTRQLEERVAERVATRVSRTAVQANREPTHVVINAGRQLLPAALGVVQAQVERAEREAVRPTNGVRRSWLLVDAYAEARTMVRMFLDYRYRPHLTWTVRVVPLLIATFIVTSGWTMPWNLVPLLGPVFDKVVAIALAFFAYKVLSREARRYREMIPDLPPGG